ncbi:MAG: response regulator [Alphaproteobacteria bacterium]|nr:response regulator [Alphaproteobacteria bacterium]
MAKLLEQTRALVVDDSRTVRLFMERALRQLGIAEIASAVDGLDAINKIEEFSPTLIVLDVDMPNMDGLEFCRWLRSSNLPQRHIPVIVMTSLSRHDQRVQAISFGATEILVKPPQPDELLATITKVVQMHQLTQVLAEPRRKQHEFALAQGFQTTLLPSERQIERYEQHFSVKIDNIYRPSEAFGGDYWGMLPLDEHKLVVYLADFSGHGMGAAINTFRLHNMMAQILLLRRKPTIRK